MSQITQAAVIIRSAWQRQLSYRFTIAMYRVGEIAEVLILLLMWSAIYASGSSTIRGFTLPEMITYVLIGTLCTTLTRNFLPSFVSRDISEGRLSMFLVKPIPYLRYIFFHEIGRIALTTLLSVVSQLIIISFFLNTLYINYDPRYWIVIFVMLLLATAIELLLGFLVGTIAFWTDEVDGIQETLDRIRRFFSGGYFPLALLPASLVAASTLLPFQYSFYAPASLWLGKMTLLQGVQGIGIQLVWVVLLSGIVHFVWSAGLRRYEATGS